MSKKPNVCHLISRNPWIKTLCKVSEKTNKQPPRYSKTDGLTDGPTKDPIGQTRFPKWVYAENKIEKEQRNVQWKIMT